MELVCKYFSYLTLKLSSRLKARQMTIFNEDLHVCRILRLFCKTPDQANGCWSVEAAYCLRYAAGE